VRQPWRADLWAEVEGFRLHARVAAAPAARARRPVVLVHGLGVASPYLEPLLAVLGRVRPALAPELPGFGRSERPVGVLDVPALARILGGAVAALAGGRAHLYGNSLGCQVAVELAVRRPELVASLVLQGPTTDPAARSLAGQAWRALRTGRHEPVSELGRVLRDYLRAGPLRVLRTERRALEHGIEERLPQVAAPALVLRGEHDEIAPAAWAARVAALLPRGQLAGAPGAHVLNYSEPGAVAARVEPFLAAVDGG
jgi:2-hydroxy-6-oxonona-2,4-dienedioate hydrolase